MSRAYSINSKSVLRCYFEVHSNFASIGKEVLTYLKMTVIIVSGSTEFLGLCIIPLIYLYNLKQFLGIKRHIFSVRKLWGFFSIFCREQICCGVIFRGPHGEALIYPKLLRPCHCRRNGNSGNQFLSQGGPAPFLPDATNTATHVACSPGHNHFPNGISA